MTRIGLLLLAALLAVCTAVPAGAHIATERYIPIGASPGLSNGKTYMGRIRAVDEDTYTLEVKSDEGTRESVRVTPDSVLWLDRSKYRRPTLDGSLKDCRPGRRVEIMLREGTGEADWVKIEAR